MPTARALRRLSRTPAALCLAAVLALAGGWAQAQIPQHVKATLAAETQGAAPGSTLYVALVQRIDQGWHTYWRNPGDAGEPTKIAWTLPAGWSAGDIVWPAPKRLPVGPLMNFGYEREAVLATPIAVPADARVGSVARLNAKASMLVCADTCVPQSADLALDVPVVAAPAPEPRFGPAISAALAAAPKPSGLTATYERRGDELRLAVVGTGLAGRPEAGAYFFPDAAGPIDAEKPQVAVAGPRGLTLSATVGGAYRAGAPIDGVLETGDGGAFEVTALQGPPPAGAAPQGLAAIPGAQLAFAALGALAGGLILNLMPCVFPILAMKAAALVRRPHDVGWARRQGLSYLAGALATFVVLGAGILALRAGGEAVGWGAQLQPPLVTAALALVLLAAALDLSGVYEIGASLQGLGSGLAAHADLLGAFVTGALAVVVAAPCTAPFMGPALGWALTRPAAEALAVFAALGLGFAAPFTLLAFSPALARRLPSPGPWMDVLRRALAFPMYGAAAWLLWVLAAETDRAGLAAALAAAVFVAAAAWLYGLGQGRSAAGARARGPYALAGVCLVLGLAPMAARPFGPPQSARAPDQLAAGVPSQPWSPGALAAARAAGRPVFVDFTAAWCVTCQVNERIALGARDAVEAFRRTRTVYLRADWTNRSDAIARALAEQGRAGVPLYLVYAADGGPPRALPQLLTSGMVAAALDDAAARGRFKPTALAAR